MAEPKVEPERQTVPLHAPGAVDGKAAARPHRRPDPHRGVIFVLLAATTLGAVATFVGGDMLGNKVLDDTAVSLVLLAGMLLGVAAAQHRRTVGALHVAPFPAPESTAEVQPDVRTHGEVATALFPDLTTKAKRGPTLHQLEVRFDRWLGRLGTLGRIRLGVGFVGLYGAGAVQTARVAPRAASALTIIIGAVACLAGTGLAATAAAYLEAVSPNVLPEARGLARGARTAAWILVLCALSIGLQWESQFTIVQVMHFALLALNVALAMSLIAARPSDAGDGAATFPVDLGLFSALGSRPNVLASAMDAAERRFGIDLRSTWALSVVRRGLEPLAISLFLLGWLSTSLTVVGVEEQALVERFGVPVAGAPLQPGLHVHWPWPVDQVYRMPVLRVQALTVGHEGEEAPGPENVLWSVEHAANEFTLVLGNGRDLITVDAAIQYRIVDPRAWRYHSVNPADALKALAYRAVMRNTVNRTLSDALSENVATLTERMRSMVQQDADALGLGVNVVGFTVGGMHPPVSVARDYEAVVSAQIAKVTAVVNAQAFRNAVVPAAENTAFERANAARAAGAEALGRAAGEAWSFRTMEAQFRAAPAEYEFRRRLEALEKALPGHPFTILDARFARDGGELWLTP